MEVRSVAIVGAGTMGGGIAQAVVCAGLNALMIDVSEEAVGKGMRAIASSTERLVSKGKLDGAAREAALARVQGSTDYASLGRADLVIEAATENMQLKTKIMQRIEGEVGEEVIIASNTSSISITRLAAQLAHPQRVIGMHFFNPVPMMPLVEIIKGLQTREETAERVRALAVALGKTPIMVRNSPGFVVNRILLPMINEAFFVLAEGTASAEEIDDGMKLGANHPLGPLALADLVGLDVCLSILDVFHADFGDSKYRAAPLLRELVAAGFLGRKTGRGVYRYPA